MRPDDGSGHEDGAHGRRKRAPIALGSAGEPPGAGEQPARDGQRQRTCEETRRAQLERKRAQRDAAPAVDAIPGLQERGIRAQPREADDAPASERKAQCDDDACERRLDTARDQQPRQDRQHERLHREGSAERDRGDRPAIPEAPDERHRQDEEQFHLAEPDRVDHRRQQHDSAIQTPVAHTGHPQREGERSDQDDRPEHRGEREREQAERKREQSDERRVDRRDAVLQAQDAAARIRRAAVEDVDGRLPDAAAVVDRAFGRVPDEVVARDQGRRDEEGSSYAGRDTNDSGRDASAWRSFTNAPHNPCLSHRRSGAPA